MTGIDIRVVRSLGFYEWPGRPYEGCGSGVARARANEATGRARNITYERKTSERYREDGRRSVWLAPVSVVLVVVVAGRSCRDNG